jgi:hypothetical protein
MSAPDERSIGGSNRAAYGKRHTHDQGGIRRVGQPCNVTGIKFDVDAAKLHIDSDMDVTRAVSAVYRLSQCARGGVLERDVCVILPLCFQALICLHALGGDACLRGN